MFNKDALFGKKDEAPRPDSRSDPRGPVNVTPDLHPGLAQRQPAPQQPEAARVYAEPPRAPATGEESAGSKLIVGPDIKLKGVEITDCDTLVVEGRVEASMDSRVVQIAQNGVFTGTATMDVAEIWGTLEGDLTVRKQLVIYGTGRVSGHVRYARIRIEEGGELSGEVSMLGASQPARTPAARPAETPAGTPRGTPPAGYEPLNRPAKPAAKPGVNAV